MRRVALRSAPPFRQERQPNHHRLHQHHHYRHQQRRARATLAQSGATSWVTNTPVLHECLRALDSSGVCWAFGYGSGVVRQGGDDASVSVAKDNDRQLDFILAVDDARSWHERNRRARPQDYSAFLRHAPLSLLDRVQQSGASILFNTLVPIELSSGDSVTIKYGVVERERLVEDLNDWTTLYVAGRLHKPVASLVDCPLDIATAQRRNLVQALDVALLLTDGDWVSSDELFHTIAHLSYAGDIRMKVGGEDPRKVERIVSGQSDAFWEMYEKLGRQASGISSSVNALVDPSASVEFDSSARVVRFDASPAAVTARFAHLPRAVLARLDHVHGVEWMSIDERRALVLGALGDIVSRSSRSQTLKGLVSAGVRKSAVYGTRKFAKSIAARRTRSKVE